MERVIEPASKKELMLITSTPLIIGELILILVKSINFLNLKSMEYETINISLRYKLILKISFK